MKARALVTVALLLAFVIIAGCPQSKSPIAPRVIHRPHVVVDAGADEAGAGTCSENACPFPRH